MDIIQRDKCEAFVTKDGSEIRELLAYRNSAIRNQSLAEATIRPGLCTDPHYHPKSEEIYYILAGSGTMNLQNEARRVVRGDAIAIPPGQVHWIENDGDCDLVLLCCCAPGYEHEDTLLVARPY